MSLLLKDDESLEVKAIKLHLAAAKHKVTIAKEHAEWSNYQLDQSKKHLKDTEKKLREAKRRVDILDIATADDDSKQKGNYNTRNATAAVSSSSTANDNNQQANSNNNIISGGKSISTIKALPPKRIRRKCSAPNCNNRVVQGGVCVTHGAKRKLCSHPGCNKAVKLAGACSMHGPGRKKCEKEGCTRTAVKGGVCITHGAHGATGADTQADGLLIKDTARISTEKTSDNKQGVLQQPPVKKKKKTTDISEGEKKTKQLSKSEYDKARRAAMKAGTWKPNPRYQPKSKRPPPQYQLPSNPTRTRKPPAKKSQKKLSKSEYDKARREAMKAGTWNPDPSKQPKRMRNGTHNTPAGGSSSGSGISTSSSGIEMLAKAAESDLLHSLFKSNTQVAKDDKLDATQTRSGRKITPSSKKKEAATK